MCKRNRNAQRGFTLTEVIVVVAILALLMGIAYPSYRDHLRKSSRVAAQNELLELSAMQEKIYLNSNAFAAKLDTAYDGSSAGGLGKTSGKTSDGKYTITLNAGTASYTLTAIAVTGSMQDGDGTFALSSNGTRTCADPAPLWCKNGVW
jgi:type IV pilus assembly protein PilE